MKFHKRTIADIDSIVEKSKKYDNRSDFIRSAVEEIVNRDKIALAEAAVAESVRKAMK